jgi:hypothetical protein
MIKDTKYKNNDKSLKTKSKRERNKNTVNRMINKPKDYKKDIDLKIITDGFCS